MAPRPPKLRIEAYDPDAVDADSDGIVQEGTAFERPAATQIVDELGNLIQAGITATQRGNFRVVNRDGSAVSYTPTYARAKPDSRLGTSLGQRQQSLGDRLPSLGARVGTLADRQANVAGERREPPKVPNLPDPPKKEANSEKFKMAFPGLKFESENDFSELQKTGNSLTGLDGVDQIFLDEIVAAVGDREFDGESLSEKMSQGYGDKTYLSLPLGQDDRIRDFINQSDITDEEKQKLIDNLDTARGLQSASLTIGKTRRPPPSRGSSDPFGFDDGPTEEWKAPNPKDIERELEEKFNALPDSFGDRISEAVKERERRQENVLKQKARREEFEREINDQERLRSIDRGRESRDRSREAPVGQALKGVEPKAKPRENEPVEGVVRGPRELEDLANNSVVKAADLTAPEHRQELLRQLKENTVIVGALDLIRDRNRRRAAGENIENSTENDNILRTGPSYVGRQLVDALVKERGFEGDALRVNQDELDLLIATRGLVPISRGGNREINRRHLENEDFPIGEGVDGAGVYVAVEGANPDLNFSGWDEELQKSTQLFEADLYAAETDRREAGTGAVWRGAVSPDAKLIAQSGLSKMIEEYRLEIREGFPSTSENTLLQLRKDLASDPNTAEFAEILDVMLLDSDDKSGEFKNGYSVASLLMGYDGISAYGKGSGDNRIVVHNRSAFIVQNTQYTPEEFKNSKQWNSTLERAKEAGDRIDYPVFGTPEDNFRWVERQMEREFGGAT
jgi:hypothetical protein